MARDRERQNGAPGEAAAPWHAINPDDALERLGASREGLGDEDAARRLEEHGPNRLRTARRKPWWRRLLDQFNNVLIGILVVAGIASLLLGQYVDAGAIFGVVLIIAVIGFVQEGKAERAVESIKGMLSPEARVTRAGARKTIAAEEVVPGDIVTIESGDQVPADIRLLEVRRLRTQEAALTGESEPVDKSVQPVEEDAELGDRTSMAYAGTLAVQGNATGVVVETATSTEIGRISEMLEEVEKLQTPLIAQLDRFGRKLAVIIVVVAAIMGISGVLVHGYALREMFMASVGLAVAAIPQGLPAIMTITLALGVQVMARRQAIIRRLPAVETLGSVSVIFSDKTGTLTRNEMTARAAALADQYVRISGVGFAPRGAFHAAGASASAAEASEEEGPTGERLDPKEDEPLRSFVVAGVLCNNSTSYRDEETGEWSIDGDPTEGALVVAAAKAGFDPDDLRKQHPRVAEIPFESERKYMATLDEAGEGQGRVIHLKGAPDTLLPRCTQVRTFDGDVPVDQEHWNDQVSALSSRGLRVLALAEKPAGDQDDISDEDVEGDLFLLGLVGLLDPPREEAKEAVGKCQSAGIHAMMVTGDHALTARAIAAQLGLERTEEAVTGRDIETLSDEELREKVAHSDVFARAAPEHKLRLVEAVQAKGRVCAMTGDGVNDAPALKRADIGVAMGVQGTEAAREASEMVLADDNFASIVNAVEEGRKVYDNIKKTIAFLLPTNGGESLAILSAVIVGTMLPVTALQILWVNMITAVTLGLALAFEPAEADLMKRAPRDPRAPILDRFLVWRVIFVSLLLLAAVYGVFLWILHYEQQSLAAARSGAVGMLVVGEAAYLVNSRFMTSRSLSISGLFGSRPVLLAIGLVVIFQLAWTYTSPFQLLFDSAPLAPHHWGIIVSLSVVIFLLVEVEKSLWRWRERSSRRTVETQGEDLRLREIAAG